MKASEIDKFMGLIKTSLKERERKQPNWELFKEYYKGRQWDLAVTENTDLITVNLVFPHVRVVLPSIFLHNPKVYFNANKPSAVNKAKVMEAVVNQDLEILDFKSQMRLVLLDALIYGTGYMKTTYFRDEVEEGAPEDRSNIIDLTSQFRGGPNPQALVPESGRTPANGPEIMRVSPFDIAFTPGARVLPNAETKGFIAHRVLKRTELIKEDPYYKNTSDLTPNYSLGDDYKESLSGYYNDQLDEALGVNELWEVWNLDKGEKFVIALDHDKALVEPEEIEYPVAHPFDILVFNDIPDEVLGISDIDSWKNQQDELNKLRTMMSRHVKRWGRKVIVKQGILEDEEKTNLESGDDSIIQTSGNPTSDVLVMPDAPLSMDTYQVSAIVKDDITEIGGLTPYKRGLLKGANTATEANIAETNSRFRDNDRIDVISEFCVKICNKIRKYREAFTEGEYIVLITGNPNDANEWKAWNRSTFTTDAELKVEYGSTAPIHSEARKMAAVQLYDRAVLNPTVNPQTAFTKLLEAFEEKDVASWFLPPAVLQAQMMQRMGMTGEPGMMGEQKGASPTATSGEPSPQLPAGRPSGANEVQTGQMPREMIRGGRTA